jgi:hypothetical protein
MHESTILHKREVWLFGNRKEKGKGKEGEKSLDLHINKAERVRI